VESKDMVFVLMPYTKRLCFLISGIRSLFRILPEFNPPIYVDSKHYESVSQISKSGFIFWLRMGNADSILAMGGNPVPKRRYEKFYPQIVWFSEIKSSNPTIFTIKGSVIHD
jgi:hypothetical protein